MVKEKEKKKDSKPSKVAIATVLAGLFTSMSILFVGNNLDVSLSYVVGVSDNVSMNTVICDKENSTSCADVSNDKLFTLSKDFLDEQIDLGKMYATRYEVSVTSGDTVFLKANSTEQTHLLLRRIFASTTGNELDYSIELFEGGKDDESKDKLYTFNVNRNYLDDSKFNIYTDVTNVDLTGALLLPFGNEELSDKKFGVNSVSEAKYVLRNDTEYYLAITNRDGGVLTATLYWQWYDD